MYCRSEIAWKIVRPTPGSVKIASITMAPPMRVPTLMPATVSNEKLDGRSACRSRMRHVGRPWLRAIRM